MIKKQVINKIFFLLFTLTLFSKASFAASTPNEITFSEDGIYVTKISSQNLEKLFLKYHYKDYIYMPEWKYPPIFLKQIPDDFDKISDQNKRNNLFLRLMIPLVLKVNNEISEERYELLNILEYFEINKDFTEKNKKFLEEKAKKYDVFTRLQGLRRYQLLSERLNEKIDIVSPSILIALAAIETNWGTSESLKKANSLYKEKVWFSDEGLAVDDPTDKSYKIKIYKNLYDSIYDYALKMNSNKDYEDFRFNRQLLKKRDKEQNGRYLANNLMLASGLKNYAGLLDYTITFYELTNIDDVSLGFVKK
ncbi:MAG: glucosaminidase domain-containing protein [Alphaproteobacteria bacterium]